MCLYFGLICSKMFPNKDTLKEKENARPANGRNNMPKKNTRNTKGKIISAAWKLFYENGYDGTTIEDIIFASGTSRGSFYHYFEGKDALLGTLAYVFDEKYEQLRSTLDPDWDAVKKLIFLNHELFTMIEDSISRDLLSGLLSTQLQAQGEKLSAGPQPHLLQAPAGDHCGRTEEGGNLRADCTTSEIIKAYAMWERALMYDWCLCGGEYSLVSYADRMTPMFLESFRKREE